MSKQNKVKSQLIQAAGGLLWRKCNDGWQLALVYRQRYDDWSLPKGKLKPGESWRQAALREVMEETGFTAHLRGFAGAVAYDTAQGAKIVRFWHMIAGEEINPIHEGEVNAVAWLWRDEALARLQYPLEQALVETWSGADIINFSFL